MTAPGGNFVPPGPLAKLKWAGIDLDGTLANNVWTPENPTSEIGEPILENVAKARRLHEDGWKNVIHTSRGWADYPLIEAWLIHHDIPFRGIICGKGLFGVMIDDRNVDPNSPDWSDPTGAVTEAFRAGFDAGFDAAMEGRSDDNPGDVGLVPCLDCDCGCEDIGGQAMGPGD